MNRFNIWMPGVIFALAACSTLTPRESAPLRERTSDAELADGKTEELEPLEQVAPATALTAEIVWRREQGWMTRSSFLSGIRPLSDGTVILTGQTSGSLTLGEGDKATTIVGRGGSYGRRTWLARYDLEGDLIWARPLAGNHIASQVITSDDSIVVTGVITPLEVDGNDFEISKVFGAGTQRQTRVPGCEPLFEKFRQVTGEDMHDARTIETLWGEPSCRIWFAARYDRDGNFQWVRTAHSQRSGRWPTAVAQSDGSVIVRFGLAGIALLDAGTPSERYLELPIKIYDESVPFLVRYEPDGSIEWVEQVSSPDETVLAWPSRIDESANALTGWRGFSKDTTDRSKYLEFPPRYWVGAVDEDANFLWNLQLEIPPETFYGAGSVADDIAQFPNGDLLIKFGYRFRDTTGVSQDGEVLHETTSNPITERHESARIQYAMRVDRNGNIRWLIPTVQAQRDRLLAGLPGILVMDDGSWLLVGAPKEGDTDYVVAPGQPNERRMSDDEGLFVARFFPDGRLDTFLDKPELSGWFPSSHRRLPDGTFLSVREDWEITPKVPTPVISRVRLGLEYVEED